jgi:hypothetical protein
MEKLIKNNDLYGRYETHLASISGVQSSGSSLTSKRLMLVTIIDVAQVRSWFTIYKNNQADETFLTLESAREYFNNLK